MATKDLGQKQLIGLAVFAVVLLVVMVAADILVADPLSEKICSGSVLCDVPISFVVFLITAVVVTGPAFYLLKRLK